MTCTNALSGKRIRGAYYVSIHDASMPTGVSNHQIAAYCFLNVESREVLWKNRKFQRLATNVKLEK